MVRSNRVASTHQTRGFGSRLLRNYPVDHLAGLAADQRKAKGLRQGAEGRGWRAYRDDLGGFAIGWALVIVLVIATALFLSR